jgi:HrpA-like RNA helicase
MVILLASTQMDPPMENSFFSSRHPTIITYEADERSVSTDFVLGLMRDFVIRRLEPLVVV